MSSTVRTLCLRAKPSALRLAAFTFSVDRWVPVIIRLLLLAMKASSMSSSHSAMSAQFSR